MIKLIMRYINSLSTIQIIPAYTESSPPIKPFATYYPISISSADFFGATDIRKEETWEERAQYRVITKLQFDVYATSYIEAIEKAKELKELILFGIRNKLSQYNFGIVSHGLIKNLTEKINEKYDFRASFDIDFEYLTMTEARRTETVKIIENQINENIKSKIGGKNGNI